MIESSEPQSPLLAKLVAMVTLFTISVILGALPMTIAKKFNMEENVKNNKFAQILLSVGGGVLMSTTFIHLLPEVSENVEKMEEFKDLKFPLAETLTCIGFFLIYLVEEAVHLYLHKHNRAPEVDIIRKSVSILRGEVNPQRKEDGDFVFSIFDLENQIRASRENRLESHDFIRIKKSIDYWRPQSMDQHNHHHHHHHDESAHQGDHNHLVGDQNFLGSMRGLLVVLALSVHEVLEGLSVGLESKPKNVWYMFGAVGAHKFIIAFCVGVELLSSGIKNRLIFVYVFTYAVVSPLGIAMGIAISSEGVASSEVPSVILQGFATGTLVYVIFFEILKKHESEGNGIVKYLAILGGFLFMFFVTVLISDDDLD
ncbi:zinc transporter ZIP1-like [Coccinella septempunctata]|uniref:zinc transporter ZIP1-like n=1 Tax=Coccinella septempunctata TaxID=41139 RepID=UPI001D0982F4|nr:zinc transporter ZIP1-like [Coccinella septempunctata]